MLNFEHIIKENISKNLIQPRRGQIFVGFQCHQKCGFCYYKNKCNEPMFSLDYIKKQIDFEFEYGIRDFEITGGEPSEYNQLKTVCQYIKSKNKDSKIAIITNGGLWKSDIWDLIDEVLISYHLSKNSIYDKNIFPLGSTYDKVKKTINIAKATNKFIRTNTVCATFNLNTLDKIIDDIIEFSPNIINFLPVNVFDNAKNSMEKFIDYNKFRLEIKKQIDKINKHLNANIYIRYMPFCDMEGYEKYIVGTLQHIYDKYDWNIELSGTQLLNIIENKNLQKSLGKYGSTSISTALKMRNIFYMKTPKCNICKYNILCDGIEKNIPNFDLYIKPCYGKIIRNIFYFNEDGIDKIKKLAT